MKKARWVPRLTAWHVQTMWKSVGLGVAGGGGGMGWTGGERQGRMNRTGASHIYSLLYWGPNFSELNTSHPKSLRCAQESQRSSPELSARSLLCTRTHTHSANLSGDQ